MNYKFELSFITFQEHLTPYVKLYRKLTNSKSRLGILPNDDHNSMSHCQVHVFYDCISPDAVILNLFSMLQNIVVISYPSKKGNCNPTFH